MTDFLSDKIRRLEEYQPNTELFPVRLDANESPFQISEALRREFAAYMESAEFNRYPDPYAGDIVSAYGAAYGLPSDHIVCGNGSDELISIICGSFIEKGTSSVVTYPDFSMYEFYSGLAEASVSVCEKKDGVGIDFDELLYLAKENGARLIIFSNPCNPTSKLYPRETILSFVRRAAGIGALAVIDEAYMDFARSDESLMKADILDSNPNLIVLRTLSKLGLAGLRLGFAAGCETLIRAIKKVKSPYNVNIVSQACGALALKRFGEFRENARVIREQTARLYAEMIPYAQNMGFMIPEPDTNFIYMRFGSDDVPAAVWKALKTGGISVRHFASQSALRVTAGTYEENSAFISAAADIFADLR